MAKRLKLEDIKTESYCYVGDKLVNTKDLTQEQKEMLANKICLTLLRQRWWHIATFWAVDKDGNRLPY